MNVELVWIVNKNGFILDTSYSQFSFNDFRISENFQSNTYCMMATIVNASEKIITKISTKIFPITLPSITELIQSYAHKYVQYMQQFMQSLHFQSSHESL